MNQKMDPNKRYIVTVGSYDGTFIKGDRIQLQQDGSITCIEAAGWIDAEHVPEAIKGIEYELDVAFYKKQNEKLQQLIIDNNKIIEEKK